MKKVIEIRYRVDSDLNPVNGRIYRTLEAAREAIRNANDGKLDSRFEPEEGLEGWNHASFEGCGTSVISEVQE